VSKGVKEMFSKNINKLWVWMYFLVLFNVVQAQEILLDVEPLDQKSEPWGSQFLGKCAVRIREYGCALTSLTMVINYYAPHYTNPLQLNEDLKRKGGYIGRCSLWWSRLNQIGVLPPNMRWETGYYEPVNLSSKIESELKSGDPVIARLNYSYSPIKCTRTEPAHFVVIVGKTADDDFLIADPYVGRIFPLKDIVIYNPYFKGKNFKICSIQCFSGTKKQKMLAQQKHDMFLIEFRTRTGIVKNLWQTTPPPFRDVTFWAGVGINIKFLAFKLGFDIAVEDHTSMNLKTPFAFELTSGLTLLKFGNLDFSLDAGIGFVPSISWYAWALGASVGMKLGALHSSIGIAYERTDGAVVTVYDWFWPRQVVYPAGYGIAGYITLSWQTDAEKVLQTIREIFERLGWH